MENIVFLIIIKCIFLYVTVFIHLSGVVTGNPQPTTTPQDRLQSQGMIGKYYLSHAVIGVSYSELQEIKRAMDCGEVFLRHDSYQILLTT